ncbi:hypothetical protein SOV92_16705 [Pectobacterium brasiliense]|uniref:High mobility group protein Z n=1 Tax=Pectobacterium brasiliense TaxID=180957 RepID=A0AAW9HG56_9GAMM|nr:hypothetical protein [Pectobacterium brasiliense]MDY4379444.1 hypothetical protein [Pectobacterium brasiliense]
MKWLFLFLILLVAFYLLCLFSKLWLLSKRKHRLRRALFNGRMNQVRRPRQKRRERF